MSTWTRNPKAAQDDWNQIVQDAEVEYSKWVSMDPSLRVQQFSSIDKLFDLNVSVPVAYVRLEAVLRDSLLKVMPKQVKDQCMIGYNFASTAILFTAMQTLLPSTTQARLESRSKIEQPLSPTTAFKECLQVLRMRIRDIGVTTSSLEGHPDPQRLFNAIWPLFQTLMSRDTLFAMAVNSLYLKYKLTEKVTMDKLKQFLQEVESEVCSKVLHDPPEIINFVEGYAAEGKKGKGKDNKSKNKDRSGSPKPKGKGTGSNTQQGKGKKKGKNDKSAAAAVTTTPQTTPTNQQQG